MSLFLRGFCRSGFLVRWLPDKTKAVQWSGVSEPYGRVASSTGSVAQNVRLPGQYDDGAGLYHNGFRDYSPGSLKDPRIGYFEADPIRLAGGMNVYAYVGGKPTRYVDPMGLGPWDKFYGLPADFWKWFHREDGGKLINSMKDPVTKQVSKEDAIEMYNFWKDEHGALDPTIALPWWAYPSNTGCGEGEECEYEPDFTDDSEGKVCGEGKYTKIVLRVR